MQDDVPTEAAEYASPPCFMHELSLEFGGGFFDRTLAVMKRKPLIVGVGYAQSRIPTIYPQPHDIPMDVILTD